MGERKHTRLSTPRSSLQAGHSYLQVFGSGSRLKAQGLSSDTRPRRLFSHPPAFFWLLALVDLAFSFASASRDANLKRKIKKRDKMSSPRVRKRDTLQPACGRGFSVFKKRGARRLRQRDGGEGQHWGGTHGKKQACRSLAVGGNWRPGTMPLLLV